MTIKPAEPRTLEGDITEIYRRLRALEAVAPPESIVPWALAQGFISALAPSATRATTFFDLDEFFTNDSDTFDQASSAGFRGIRILRTGLYKLTFDVTLIRATGEANPETKAAFLSYTGGGSDFEPAAWEPGIRDTYGVKTTNTASRGTWMMTDQVLWNYETGATFPATRITVGASHNASGNVNASGNILIERIDDQLVGGFF